MKKQLSFTLLFLLSTTLVRAKNETILVSDIDDTIKVSHVLDPDSAVANAVSLNNAFMGMPELYQSLLKDKRAQKFYYLSAAPDFAMKKMHEKFIQKNGFPAGTLLLSKGVSNKMHKITSLREIITKQQPKELILVGDNGERDPEIYAQIRAEYPQLKMTTYIHQVYSLIGFHNNIGKHLEEGQIGFATSVDLAYQLRVRGYLSKSYYDGLLKNVIPSALAESNYVERGRNMMFPAWMDCRDFNPFQLLTMTNDTGNLVQKFETRIIERCTSEPYLN